MGRPNRVIYPDTGLSTNPFSTRNVYNQFGYLKEVRVWLDSDSGLPTSQLQGQIYWHEARQRGDGHAAGVAPK